jgi:hypothetical protein
VEPQGERQGVKPTVSELIQRYIVEMNPIKPIGGSHMYALRRLQRSPLGAKVAAELKASDIIDHCRWRKTTPDAKGKMPQPATVMQDVTCLRGPLTYAALGWDMPDVTVAPIAAAMPMLKKYNLVGKSKPRDRRPTQQELDLLLEHFRKQNEHPRTVTDMVAVTEFSYYSARRISETCRLRWGDVNGADMTCVVRDMKDPKFKKGNDHEFPLLGRAWDIVQERVALRKTPENPDERIFPFSSKTCSQRYTLAKKALAKLHPGLFINLRLHDNRREAASRAFEGKLNGRKYSVPEVMVVTGHKTPQMLMRVYTHLHAKDLHPVKPEGTSLP